MEFINFVNSPTEIVRYQVQAISIYDMGAACFAVFSKSINGTSSTDFQRNACDCEFGSSTCPIMFQIGNFGIY